MEYTTNDLSSILDVSTNTIRRYEEKGYLRAKRNEENGYRQFDASDVERLMYVRKYRKVGFEHKDIAGILRQDIGGIRKLLEERKAGLDAQIVEYQALSHLLKDDIALIDRVKEYGDGIFEMANSPCHYVIYQKKGELRTGGRRGEALHRFLSTCPEFEYIYLFDREDLEADHFVWSAGVAANQLITQKYHVDTASPVESYERHFCLMRFLRAPLDLLSGEQMPEAAVKKLFFDDFLEYMREHDYRTAGDAMALKIGFSREDGQDWQYLLMHVPVDKAENER